LPIVTIQEACSNHLVGDLNAVVVLDYDAAAPDLE